MNGKADFIVKIEELLIENPNLFNDEALAFFESLKTSKKTNGAKEITENGIKILNFMQENHVKYNNVFKAKDIGVGIFTSGKAVSGSMRKLVADGYVSKEGKDPVMYALTDKGMEFTLD